MGFIIINNQKVNENRIEWRFETMDRVFVSTADKFKRNVEFWKQKYNIGAEVQIEILNGAKELYDHLQAEKNTVDVEHEEIKPETYDTPIDQSPVESSDDIVDAESSVSENTEDLIDTPKPRSRKKAS